MTDLNVDILTAALGSTYFSPKGVSFAGKSLKLDTEADGKLNLKKIQIRYSFFFLNCLAKPVIEAIEKCENLQFLNLEGNTLGVESSAAIAKALEKHPEFKQALWKDMFTGRMKTEIPKALVSFFFLQFCSFIHFYLRMKIK